MHAYIVIFLDMSVFGTVSAAYVQAANAPNDVIRNKPVLEEKVNHLLLIIRI